jgi:predicted transcriptional regulator of viral defense system
MNQLNARKILEYWDKKKKFVFTKHELRKLFADDSPKAFDEGLQRLVKSGLLLRACRGIYLFTNARSMDSYVIEHIAKALRQGDYNYISLESILSEYGVISQIPIDRLTVMTTGRSGVYRTFYGVIEFTHTKRSITNIIDRIISIEGRPLRIASKETAWRDLKRVGRNIDMVNLEELDSNE